MPKKIVLAYSGGLDTSVLAAWLRETEKADIIALSIDVGQETDWERLNRRAKEAKVADLKIVDAREEFARDFCQRVLSAGALYENRYPLVSALSRPLISKLMVETAREYGADAVAHGCTGKGNDQVRFEVSCRALAPELEVLAPVRTWGFTRADSMAYAEKHGISIEQSKAKPYSIDDNLWGRAIECGALEDTWNAPPDDIWSLTAKDDAKAKGEIVIGFQAGKPVSLDGKMLPPHELVIALNARVGPTGWGRLDMVENRRVGIKSRECYEAPGALALYAARAELESMCLERDLSVVRRDLSPRYAQLTYDGLWFSPLRESLDAFFTSCDQVLDGEVRLALEPGRCYANGRRAPRGLYDYELATYEAEDTFRHDDSAGFVRLWGLATQVWSMKQGPASRGRNQ